eukprot:CAMPEP_0197454912 /NCGR_PEP_ID=MMETSP1175-20131217/39354_1 /TAXON_ID=1003142 /ORGANISM="Triceratium dubium, Strain CCMP147" /LENGTH=196 /DNA_ID=CAMNT_0042988629 /DNA_START=461 /DNA_END=1049 /DNA_ORIENTATION=+
MAPADTNSVIINTQLNSVAELAAKEGRGAVGSAEDGQRDEGKRCSTKGYMVENSRGLSTRTNPSENGTSPTSEIRSASASITGAVMAAGKVLLITGVLSASNAPCEFLDNDFAPADDDVPSDGWPALDLDARNDCAHPLPPWSTPRLRLLSREDVDGRDDPFCAELLTFRVSRRFFGRSRFLPLLPRDGNDVTSGF